MSRKLVEGQQKTKKHVYTVFQHFFSEITLIYTCPVSRKLVEEQQKTKTHVYTVFQHFFSEITLIYTCPVSRKLVEGQQKIPYFRMFLSLVRLNKIVLKGHFLVSNMTLFDSNGDRNLCHILGSFQTNF